MKMKSFFWLLIPIMIGILTITATALPPKQKILMGGLFSITGGWSTLGNSSAAAIEIAAQDVNKYFDRIGLNLEVSILIKDTELEPQLALKRLQELSADGVRLVIGPQSSAEIANIRTFAQQKGILLLSPSSTAGTLSLAGDNVFRLCPDDRLEGEAISALMLNDGIRVVVPIWRDDAGNGGLEVSTRAHFTKKGGTVLSGVKYAPDTTDFSPPLDALENQIREALAQRNQNASEVGVYLAAFDEVVSIFNLAASNTALSSIRWYGSDGVALSQTLLADANAAAFASEVKYPNPLPGLSNAASIVWRPIVRKIKEQTGTEPEAFALGVYDAVWIAARTVALRPSNVTTHFVRQQIPGFASSYFGATGWTILNKAGDRRFGDFDFWAIRNVDSSPQWVRIGNYNSASKTLNQKEGL